jgi:hypothetical protein
MTTKEMFDALVSLYQSQNINRKMILWNKLRSIGMTRLDTITSYLMKITQIRDQLATVGEKVENAKFVNMALNGFPTYGNHLSKLSALGKTLLTLRGLKMIISRRRLRWSQRSARRMVKRT